MVSIILLVHHHALVIRKFLWPHHLVVYIQYAPNHAVCNWSVLINARTQSCREICGVTVTLPQMMRENSATRRSRPFFMQWLELSFFVVVCFNFETFRNDFLELNHKICTIGFVSCWVYRCHIAYAVFGRKPFCWYSYVTIQDWRRVLTAIHTLDNNLDNIIVHKI